MAVVSHESAAPSVPQTFAAARLSRDGVAEAGLIALLLLAPLPLGSVHAGAVFVIALWIALLAWLALPMRADGLPAALRPWPWLCAGALALAGWQILPLPAGLARGLSPAAAALRDRIPLAAPPAWMPLSVHPEATGSAIVVLAAALAAFLVSAKLAAREGAPRRILGAIFGAGLFQAVYGSAEYLSGHQHIFAMPKRFYTDSATGTYVNQNHYAGALEMALLVGLGFVLAHSRRAGAEPPSGGWRERLVSAFEERRAAGVALMVGTAVVGLGLVFSYSRAGIAGASLACAAVLVAHALRGHDRRWIAPTAVLVGGLLLLITLAGWDRTLADLERQLQPISMNASRVRVWRDSLHIFAAYPVFGTGLGTFPDIYPAYRHENIQLIYDAAHNDYVQLAVEAGLAGLAAALVIFSVYAFTLLRAMARAPGRDAPLWLGAAGGAAALLLHELVDFNLHIPANAVLFAALTGVLLGGATAHPKGDAAQAEGRVLTFMPRRRADRRRSRQEARLLRDPLRDAATDDPQARRPSRSSSRPPRGAPLDAAYAPAIGDLVESHEPVVGADGLSAEPAR